MKQLNMILVFVVALLTVCGRCAPVLAQEASAPGTLGFQAQDVAAPSKACKPTSTSARCLLTAIAALQAQVSSLQTALTAVQNNHALALGSFVSVDSSAENGLKGPNIIFSGANVHIVSGSGNTVDTSGLGNLVIGYNEDSDAASTIDGNRSGSHNLVVGSQHEFTSSASVVFGFENFTSADYATISGGEGNKASGLGSSVSGGAINTASAEASSISGGESNTVSGFASSISGGESNTASGDFSSILGGNTESVTTKFGIFP